MKIETITKEHRTIIQVGFEVDVRMKMQEKIKQLYRLSSPSQDFSKYYPFDIDQLSDWVDVLNWESVSSNKQVKWSDELIRKFKDKWHWFNLWLNQSVLCWDIKLLEKFEDKIIWDFILNTSISWNEALHERFKNHLASPLYDYCYIVKMTCDSRERFLNNSYQDLSDNFMKLYLYAKDIDDTEGIFILYDAVEVFLNDKVSIKPMEEDNSSPLC